MHIRIVKNAIIIVLSAVFIFSFTSCYFNKFDRFMDYKPEYDYLVFEFSETSYAWLDCCNINGYGEWTFGEKTIAIDFFVAGNENKIVLGSLEDDLEPGKIYQDKILAEEAYFSDHLLAIYIDEIDATNKTAFGFRGNDYKYMIQEAMFEEDNETIIIRKLSSEEWREWMKEHSLDPDLYVPSY